MLRVTQLSGFGIGSGEVTIPGTLTATAGAYSLTGTAATITKATATNKTLTAGAGAYSLTGAAAGLTKAGSMSSEATAFLARTSGLDTTHINAYVALIDGLVADGIWAKLDVLHVYATQDSTTARLNLVSTSYPATLSGSPTFTADRGYTGVESSFTIYIDTGFNPTTASSPKYVLNSAHLSVWNVTDVASNNSAIGAQDGSANSAYIIVKYAGGSTYFRINTGNVGSGSYAAPNTTGHYIGNRTGSGGTVNYRNGTAVATESVASSTLPNGKVYTLGGASNGVNVIGVGNQQAMASIGSSLNGTEAGNFYTRLRTYMTAVGVP